jgi:hypothetical protein
MMKILTECNIIYVNVIKLFVNMLFEPILLANIFQIVIKFSIFFIFRYAFVLLNEYFVLFIQLNYFF